MEPPIAGPPAPLPFWRRASGPFRRKNFFPWERLLVTSVAAVVGLYGGIAAGLFATSIRFVQLLVFRGREVFVTLFGPERQMWGRYFFERLVTAHWHLEFAALAALLLLAGAVLEWLGASARLPLFEARRLRAVALAAVLGLALYYPLVLLQTFNGTFHEPEGGLYQLLQQAPRWLWLLGPALGALLAALLVRYLSPESGATASSR